MDFFEKEERNSDLSEKIEDLFSKKNQKNSMAPKKLYKMHVRREDWRTRELEKNLLIMLDEEIDSDDKYDSVIELVKNIVDGSYEKAGVEISAETVSIIKNIMFDFSEELIENMYFDLMQPLIETYDEMDYDDMYDIRSILDLMQYENPLVRELLDYIDAMCIEDRFKPIRAVYERILDIIWDENLILKKLVEKRECMK